MLLKLLSSTSFKFRAKSGVNARKFNLQYLACIGILCQIRSTKVEKSLHDSQLYDNKITR